MTSLDILFHTQDVMALPSKSQLPLEQLLHGTHVVLGAPASGKTQQLRLLVAYAEHCGYSADDILVLTPNRLAATRLRDAIGLDSINPSTGPRARSLSSLAFELMQSVTPQQKLLSGAGQQAMLRALVEKSKSAPWGYDLKTITLQGFIQELRDLLAICIEFNLSEAALESLAGTFSSRALLVAAEILPQYLQQLEKENAVDASQLLVQADGHTSHRLVVVDDAQELTKAGIDFLKRITKDKALVVFGDPDAAVLGFRSGLVGGFVEQFAQASRHYLASAHPFSGLLSKLAEKLPTQLAGPQRLKSTEQSGSLTTKYFANQVSEADWLAGEIRKFRLTENLSWDQMAVVGRTRNQLEQLADALAARGVPVQLGGVQLALRDQYMARAILEIAALAFGALDDQLPGQLLQSPLVGLDSIAIRRLERQLANLESFASTPRSRLLLEAIAEGVEPNSWELRKFMQFRELVQRVRLLSGASAHELVSEIWRSVDQNQLAELSRGSTEPALAANRDLDSALELFAAAMRFDQNQLGTATDFVRWQLEQAVPEDSLAPIGLKPAVQLLTASQLIDRRFEVVAVPRLQDGIWPNLRPRTSLLGASSLAAFLAGRTSSPSEPVRGELSDEIRLFYKAIGACESKLLLTAMVSSEEQPSQFFELLGLKPELSEGSVSFDLRRLVGTYRRQLAQGDLSVAGTLATLALLEAPGADPSGWQGLLPVSTEDPLVDPEATIRFSPSRLEAFERCPVHWFIQNFSGDGQGFEASLGTLLHAALELAADEAGLYSYLESNWHTLEFETDWQAKAQKRKALNMAHAIALYLGQSSDLVASEQKFEFQIGRLQISGKIDRVERSEDGTIRVVDLKTGKTPTLQEVAEHRQLAVYQLALKYQGEPKTQGVIVSVGEQRLKVLEQPALQGEFEEKILQLLEEVAQSAGESSFTANYSDHCSDDSKCQLLIGKVVTDA
jgi:superfamily I DNA/RNA helicase/RecB family exonuclease